MLRGIKVKDRKITNYQNQKAKSTKRFNKWTSQQTILMLISFYSKLYMQSEIDVKNEPLQHQNKPVKAL